jgi:hypothetical protein
VPSILDDRGPFAQRLPFNTPKDFPSMVWRKHSNKKNNRAGGKARRQSRLRAFDQFPCARLTSVRRGNCSHPVKKRSIPSLQKAAPRNFDAFFELFVFRSKKRQSKFLRCFDGFKAVKLLPATESDLVFAGRKSRLPTGFPVPSFLQAHS